MTGAGRRWAAAADGGLRGLLDRFADLDLLVVGDAMLDAWLWGPPRGLSREGPVPVVSVTARNESPGGAGNAALAVSVVGARARLVGIVGDDADGRRLGELLDAGGVGTDGLVAEPGRATLAKRRICSGSHLHLRCDTGDETPPAPATAAALAARVAASAPAACAVLACDYGAGMYTPELIDRVGAAAHAAGRWLVVDAHDPARWAAARPDLVKPNAGEVVPLLPHDARDAFARDRVGTVRRCAGPILAASGARLAAVTLDRDGVVVLTQDDEPWHLPAGTDAPDERTSGAGDTFIAAMVLALAAGAAPRAAAGLASLAACAAVSTPGTGTCSAADLRARLLAAGDDYLDDPAAGGSGGSVLVGGVGGVGGVVVDAAGLADAVVAHRARGRRIVFTNGCFDVIHAGHVAYLDAARRLGDVLVVAVNSDAGVRRLKGPDRPINGLADRLAVLTALAAVDHVVVFDDDTPAQLLRALRPDVYVKGGDYTESMLAEAPLVRALGGEVRFVDYVADRSTSDLLGRIRRGAALP
ncbi:D-glycero-beta-D-manno-heptose 1-phosphate adenylyltransferase [Frankia sp. QA3]|uniref:D-glycero-beta-D-manno-heptose 1-phosphate adenylyltransferase n=1 Tax=Frankia sp. QA3 TaxID=710111 RepID=UPI000269BF94|nr:D-glycero-beta-D-manno-heptose 1-phosphate adenylyltransferase [Frankia sp. QA3]EIV91509.1 D-heptose-1-phosphate adenylyltransferase [Frankia sp. QA3]